MSSALIGGEFYRLIKLALTKNIVTTASAIFKKPREITIGRTDDDRDFTIKLNNRNVKTPLKNLLRIPDETLTHIIANEWKAQSPDKINLTTMHTTTLANTAIDNPFDETVEALIESILEYLQFDTLRFRTSEPPELFQLQQRHWDPIVDWFEFTYKCQIPIEYGNLTAPACLPTDTHQKISRHLGTHKRWPLVGLKFMTENLKSFILAASLAERFLQVEPVVTLARLETKYQTEKWSSIEWEHDLDEQAILARVSAGTLFYHLSLIS